jgi:hypothetical protein
MRNLVINDTNLSTKLITVTPFSASSRRANAIEIVDPVQARTSVPARVRGAIVHVYLAVGAGESGGALAQEPVDAVNALAAVLARLGDAVVHVVLTVVALEAVLADALVVVAGVDASAPVQAGVGAARGLLGDVTRGA